VTRPSAQAELDEALVGIAKQGFVKLSLSGGGRQGLLTCPNVLLLFPSSLKCCHHVWRVVNDFGVAVRAPDFLVRRVKVGSARGVKIRFVKYVRLAQLS
jgi:hypothetical protein